MKDNQSELYRVLRLREEVEFLKEGIQALGKSGLRKNYIHCAISRANQCDEFLGIIQTELEIQIEKEKTAMR